MSHFTLQVSPSGPIVDAIVGVSLPRRNALLAANQQVPNTVSIRGLLDTGASGTAVDPSVLTALGLTPTGTILVNTPTTGANPVSVDQYDVAFIIPGPPKGSPLLSLTLPVVASELLIPQGFHALIGRDILSQCVFVYNGSGFFTLGY
ncbi:MAG: aspartyl protease family protein [Vicinamibacterales bacterium]